MCAKPWNSTNNTILKKQKPLFKKNKNRAVKTILWLTLVVSFIAITFSMIYEYLLTSDFFTLKEITVNGNNLLHQNFILKKAQLDMGTNLFKLKTEEAQIRIMNIRLIKDASIKKSFPSSVIINIEEHKPVALLLFEEKLFYVAKNGKLLTSIKSKLVNKLENKTDYPIITGFNKTFNAADKSEYMNLALELLETISQTKYLNDLFISEINVDKKNGLSIITTKNSIPILFGFDEFKKKLNYLHYVFSDIAKRKIKVAKINLSFNKKVVVKTRR